jgi:pimeloyl-ACP methyl ester carboxylesterase
LDAVPGLAPFSQARRRAIRGLRQSRLSWDRQFADNTLAGFSMVRFDLRGHGDSDKPTALDAYSASKPTPKRRKIVWITSARISRIAIQKN